jgi:hypothetical protein
VSTLDEATRRSMIAAGTWRPGCPVDLDDLRLVSVSYWGFDQAPHTGRLVVNRDAASAIVSALRRLYAARFPIRRMELVDRYGADDERSMRADNTSAFNGRKVPGTGTWSQHAYGRAIDVNPLENPEIANGEVDPPQAAPYVDRSQRVKGMIHAGDVVVRAFATAGWKWGGDWHSLKDYQHFSANGY